MKITVENFRVSCRRTDPPLLANCAPELLTLLENRFVGEESEACEWMNRHIRYIDCHRLHRLDDFHYLHNSRDFCDSCDFHNFLTFMTT